MSTRMFYGELQEIILELSQPSFNNNSLQKTRPFFFPLKNCGYLSSWKYVAYSLESLCDSVEFSTYIYIFGEIRNAYLNAPFSKSF